MFSLKCNKYPRNYGFSFTQLLCLLKKHPLDPLLVANVSFKSFEMSHFYYFIYSPKAISDSGNITLWKYSQNIRFHDHSAEKGKWRTFHFYLTWIFETTSWSFHIRIKISSMEYTLKMLGTWDILCSKNSQTLVWQS